VPRYVAQLVTLLVAPLVVDYSACHRLVVDYFASAARPGASARRASRHAAQYHNDISEDEVSANVPADETTNYKNAWHYHNRKRNERRRRLRETLPIWNLNEALDQVANRVHTTPEQCLMSITTIACQAQWICTGEVVTKLAEDTYFMRVDNRVTLLPPVRTHEPKHQEVTSRSPADAGRNRTRGE
jgi:hypothetical protein